MIKAILTRTFKGSNTLGQLDVFDGAKLLETVYTLELPDKNNKPRISCIPIGKYKVKKHYSPKFGKCFWIKDVPNRSEILIHPANYTNQLLGCIAVGLNHADINNDNELDLISSKLAMAKILKFDINELEIIEI